MPIPAGTAIDIRTDVEGPYNGCTWTDASGTYGQALSGTDWWVFESDLGNSGYLYMSEYDDNPATVAPNATVFVCWEVAKWPGSSTADVAACINVNPSGAFPAFNLSTASPSLITVSGSNTANVGIRYDGGGQWTVWEKKPPNTFDLYTHLCDIGGNRAGSAGGNILPAGAGLMYGACWYETAGGNSQPTAFSSTYDEDVSDSVTSADSVLDMVVFSEDVAESETAADAHSDEITAAEAVGESGTADDAVSDSVAGGVEAIEEVAAADDSISDGVAVQETVSENASAYDAVDDGSEPPPAPAPAPAPHAAPTGRRVPLVHMTYRGRSYVGPADQVQRAVETQARLDAEQEEPLKNKRSTRVRAYQRAETLPVSITRVEMPGLPVQGSDPELLRVVEEELRRAYQLSMRTALNDAMAVAEARARRAIIEQNNAIAMAAAERLLLG